MFYKIYYNEGEVLPSIQISDDEYPVDYFLISPILNLAVGVIEGPDDDKRKFVMDSFNPRTWSDGISIRSAIPTTLSQDKGSQVAFQLYSDRVATINSNLGFMIRQLGMVSAAAQYPWYLIIDGDAVTLQGYDYFWDPDDRFQSVFRDRMGGNHQWLFNWYNLGGRSGVADIMEVSVSPVGLPLLKYYWENGEPKYKKLLQFIKESCRTQDVAEFNKRANYIKDRGRKHVEEGDMEPNEALDYALRDLKSAAKRQDPDVFYQEYAEMGFDHPRPDYKDKKWKL